MDDSLTVTFSKIYANLPLAARQEVVAVIDGEPMSWNAVYLEVENNTEKGKKALSQLVELKIISKE